MSFNGQLLATGGVAQCLTDSVQVFGADGAYSSNIAVYQFNGNANDATTNYNATTQGSPSYVTGKFGQAASLSNSDTDYFTTSISPTILGNSFSLSAWVYFTQNSGGSDYYSIAGAYWNGSSGNQSWIFYVNNGTLSFFSNLTSGSITVTGGTVPLNQWNFVAFSIDDKNQISLNLNGAITTSAVSLSLRSNSINLTLGNLGPYNASRTMYGLLDQVRVFNRALSASELNVLYNETDSTTSNTNLFNEGAGVALYTLDYDASDAGGLYDGTPSNVLFGVEGQINTAGFFDGSTVAADIVLGSSFISAFDVANKSFSLWFNWDGSNPGSNGYGMPFFMNGTGLSNGRIGVQITNSNGTITAYSGTAGSNPTSTISANTWYHFALVVSGSSYEAFVNGSSIGTATNNNGVDSGTQTASIGSWFSSNYYFTGDIDQVRFFRKSLSQEEIDVLVAENPCNYTCTTDTTNYPTTNLAYYKLDNSADDETGVYDGTSTDVFYAFGRFNQAAVFNGSSSIIKDILGSGFTYATKTMTFSAWIFVTDNSNDNMIIGDGLTTATGGWGISTGYGNAPNQRLSFSVASSAMGGVQQTYSSVSIADDTWTHIAVSVDFSSVTDSIKMYINGTEDTSLVDGISGSFVDNTTYNTSIGGTWSGSAARFFEGSIDQVRIFETALTSSQVSELYNEKPCADTSNFAATLYEGNSSYVSNVGFQPDLLWVKGITFSSNNRLFDVVRTASAGSLSSNQTAVNATASGQIITSFEANGFIAPLQAGDVNQSGQDFVAWNWKAGGNAVLNEEGTIDSQVSANTGSGFSIATFTGVGYPNATNAEVGHGLTQAPDIVFIKGTGGTGQSGGAGAWVVGTGVLASNNWTGAFYLNSSAAYYTAINYFFNGAATDSVVKVKTDWFVNGANNTYVMYSWHSVSGQSSISTYEGDGTNDNSKQITGLGFDPSFVMVKNVDSAGGNWDIIDKARGGGNNLYANESFNQNANTPSSYGSGQFISGGFSVTRGSVASSVQWNKSGDTYLYMAFK
mgnify:CR=1 FL=1|tara:strand:+ start:3229 stop:6306 length:3078 start_codon:yes stop_codon:yes gene_type:complete